MKHDFMKLAMAGILAGFCVSATAASSSTSETAVIPEEAVQEIVVLEAPEATESEVTMSKCSKDDGDSCEKKEKPCKEEKPKPCAKGAAQHAMGQ